MKMTSRKVTVVFLSAKVEFALMKKCAGVSK